ncbi:hypothetical protein E2C01_091513 [Portunus trituberculatus]|uniref:Uncharacterized protein n=1 Tax=Portunus trituberculatus TaxID=210409 RepID=A0A5B7JV87_PORTR|nr:hypothetical protein [Portunus trituberculatus]
MTPRARGLLLQSVAWKHPTGLWRRYDIHFKFQGGAAVVQWDRARGPQGVLKRTGGTVLSPYVGLGGIRVLDPDPPDPTRQEGFDYQSLVLESTDDYLLAETNSDESGTQIQYFPGRGES